MSTALALYQLSGRWPIDVIASVIPLQTVERRHQDGLQEGRFNQADIERWSGDGTTDRLRAEHTIVRGVLQLAASELLQQAPQRADGDRELYEGVERLERVRTGTDGKASIASRKKGKRRPPDAGDDL